MNLNDLPISAADVLQGAAPALPGATPLPLPVLPEGVEDEIDDVPLDEDVEDEPLDVDPCDEIGGDPIEGARAARLGELDLQMLTGGVGVARDEAESLLDAAEPGLLDDLDALPDAGAESEGPQPVPQPAGARLRGVGLAIAIGKARGFRRELLEAYRDLLRDRLIESRRVAEAFRDAREAAVRLAALEAEQEARRQAEALAAAIEHTGRVVEGEEPSASPAPSWLTGAALPPGWGGTARSVTRVTPEERAEDVEEAEREAGEEADR